MAQTPEDAAPPAAGTSDLVHYRVIQEIGRGGQGIVYLAEDRRRHKKVALKVLRNGADMPEDALWRLQREVEAAARLDLPGVCAVHEAVLSGPSPFIAMRYVEGRTLAQMIAAEQQAGDRTWVVPRDGHAATRTGSQAISPNDVPSGPSTKDEVHRILLIIEKAARTLHGAHEAKVVHRDVKPGNIMVTPEGEPVILDFGLAFIDESRHPGETRPGEIWGTPVYLSPEQITPGRKVDRRADVWSLGVTLFEALTLRRPFDGPTNHQIFHAIQSKDPPNPCKLNRALTPDLRIVLETALEKDRDRRYETALALADDLKAIREGAPIAARPVGSVTRLTRWARRNPAIASLLAVTFGVLLAGLVITWSMYVARASALDEASQALWEKDTALLRERDARRRSDGMRLLSESAAAVSRDPGLALLLALEGGARAPDRRTLVNGTVNEVLAQLREERTFAGHVAEVDDVGFSPDGTRIVTAAQNGEVRIWDRSSGAVVRSVEHPSVVRAAFTPDGSHVVSLGSDGTFRAFDAGNGEERPVIDGFAVQLSGDAGSVLTVRDRAVSVWDTATGARVSTIEQPVAGGTRLMFSGNATRVLAIAPNGGASVFNARTGKLISARPGAFPGIKECGFSADGLRVAAVFHDAGRGHDVARVWDVDHDLLPLLWDAREDVDDSNAEPSAPLDVTGAKSIEFNADASRVLIVTAEAGYVARCDTGKTYDVCSRTREPGTSDPSAAFVLDGSHVLGASCHGTAHVVNADTGQEVHLLSGDVGDVRYVKASADGSLVLTGSDSGSATLWRASDAHWAQVASLRGHSGRIRHATFHKDRTLIATASADRTARLWRLRGTPGAPLIEGHRGPIRSVRFTRDGRRALTSAADGMPRVWDLEKAAIVVIAGSDLVDPEISDDGSRVIARTTDGRARLVDVATGEEVPLEPDAPGAVTHVGFAVPYAFTADDTGTVDVWDQRTGARVARLKGHDHRALQHRPLVSPDGARILVMNSAGDACVHAVDSGELLTTLPHRGSFPAFFSSRGRHVLVETAALECEVRDIEADATVATLHVHDGVRLHAFSPDDRTVLGTTADGAVQLWDVATAKLRHVARGRGSEVAEASFSPDGRWIVAVSQNGTRVLDGTTADEAWSVPERHGRVTTARFSPDGTWLLAGYAGGLARLWPSDPVRMARSLTSRAITLKEIDEHALDDPEAIKAVLAVFGEAVTTEEMIQRLEDMPAMSDALRSAALRAARAQDPHEVAARLRRRAWDVVCRRDQEVLAYQKALQWIRQARELHADVEGGHTTLGAAQLRNRDPRAALETLQQAVRATPVGAGVQARARNLALIALVHKVLGEHAQAQSALNAARQAIEDAHVTPAEDVRMLLEEAGAP